jgi:hypothetical protein
LQLEFGRSEDYGGRQIDQRRQGLANKDESKVVRPPTSSAQMTKPSTAGRRGIRVPRAPVRGRRRDSPL